MTFWWQLERRFWEAWGAVRHPIDTWYWWRKWRHRPKAGEQVRDCRHQVHTVVAYGATEDDLIFEDGSKASWMHCCDSISQQAETGGGDGSQKARN